MAYRIEHTLGPLDYSDYNNSPLWRILRISGSSYIRMPYNQSPGSYNIVSVVADI